MWQDFVLQISAFGILSTVVLNLIPKEIYKKYIRLTLGFLLILLIAKPVIFILGQEETVNSIFRETLKKVEDLEAEPEYDAASEAYQELLRRLYEEKVKEMGEEPWQTEEASEQALEN